MKKSGSPQGPAHYDWASAPLQNVHKDTMRRKLHHDNDSSPRKRYLTIIMMAIGPFSKPGVIDYPWGTFPFVFRLQFLTNIKNTLMASSR